MQQIFSIVCLHYKSEESFPFTLSPFNITFLLICVNNHFTECEGRSLQPVYKQSSCSLQTLIMVAIKLHTITG